LARWRYPMETPRAAQKEQRVVLELKVIRAKRTKAEAKKILSDGLEQTARYAETNDATEAHLIVCDERAGRKWGEKIYERSERSGSWEIKVWGV
ncbi:MAG: hypothetical protein FWG71_11110, partial [Synergistaceae bacterium]|nr:hypothetical protein [Synergistaceae bacterium]